MLGPPLYEVATGVDERDGLAVLVTGTHFPCGLAGPGSVFLDATPDGAGKDPADCLRLNAQQPGLDVKFRGDQSDGWVDVNSGPPAVLVDKGINEPGAPARDAVGFALGWWQLVLSRVVRDPQQRLENVLHKCGKAYGRSDTRPAQRLPGNECWSDCAKCPHAHATLTSR